MKHFVLTINGQSVTFSEGDLKAMDSAMTAAANLPGREIQRSGQSGTVMAVLQDDAGDGHFRDRLPLAANTQRLTDLKRGPAETLTDC